jgi:hypothetical protein
MIAVLCGALMLSLAASPSWSSQDEYENLANDATSPAAFDLLILRPIGIITAGISTLAFLVPVLPIVLITRPQDIGRPFDKMVLQPVRYVVADPLGKH